MKCVCGYEHLREWQLEEGQTTGDKEFITLQHPVIRIEDECFDGWHGSPLKDVDIYACPKCGTLKIEV